MITDMNYDMNCKSALNSITCRNHISTNKQAPERLVNIDSVHTVAILELTQGLGEWSKTCRYCEGRTTANLAKLE